MSETDAEFVDRLVGRTKGGDIGYVLVVSSREEQTRLLSLARRGAESADTIAALRAENEKLRAALCPLADVFLYPDDLGFEASSDIKEDLDWDDDANDMNTENVFVLRRDIRRARAALTQETRDE